MSAMSLKVLLFFFFLLKAITSSEDSFTFNGFNNVNLSLDGVANITSNGLLQMTNSKDHRTAHAFYPTPLHFRSATGKIFSFSTTFVLAFQPELSDFKGDGMAFLISRTTDLTAADAYQFLGLFTAENNGNSANHIFAVEFDTVKNSEFQDIDDNHVGIDINSVTSIKSHSAGYYKDGTGLFENMSLISDQSMQVWIDFHGDDMQLNVTMSPVGIPKPKRPLLATTIDFSSLMLDSMYAGFSSSSGGSVEHVTRCFLGWSFKMNGTAEALDFSKLPSLPRRKGNSDVLRIWLPIAVSLFILLLVAASVLIVRYRMKYAEVVEDWELEYSTHRFSYKDLFRATNGFKENELLGTGGFGSVYRGVLPSSKIVVAVKKVSHESCQGMKQFVAEIVSIGQMRHRNLVQLLGYCRRKGELLLVYEFMPNGSLDKFLYDRTNPTLGWAQRFRIIKGVASGLFYLHEGWGQVVVHRDIKASNVLLDSDLNGRLGDFGLARLYDHGTDPQSTHVVGTRGYLAPELARTGKATVAIDVFAFGAFLLEVACGRRPVHLHAKEEELILADWVLASWQRGQVLETRDSRLGEEYSAYELELVLKLGLLCSNPMPQARPSMRQVVQFLDGDTPFPELPPSYMSFSSLFLFHNDREGFSNHINSFSLVGSHYFPSEGR